MPRFSKRLVGNKMHYIKSVGTCKEQKKKIGGWWYQGSLVGTIRLKGSLTQTNFTVSNISNFFSFTTWLCLLLDYWKRECPLLEFGPYPLRVLIRKNTHYRACQPWESTRCQRMDWNPLLVRSLLALFGKYFILIFLSIAILNNFNCVGNGILKSEFK